MKQKLVASTILSIFLISFFFTLIPVASAVVNYSTQFNDLTGWTTYADYKAELTSSTYISAPTSFQCSANGASQYNYGHRSIAGLNTHFKFEIFIRPFVAGTSSVVIVGFDDSEPMYVRIHYVNPTQFKFAHYDGASNRVLNDTLFTQNAWYNLTTEINIVEDTMKTYVNGSLTINESVALDSSPPPSTFWVDTLSWGGVPTGIYVDDLIVTSFDDPPTYSGLGYSSTYVGITNYLSVTVDDDVNLTVSGGYILATNNSGPWVNTSWVPFTSTPQTVSVQITNNETEYQKVGYQFFFNDTAGTWNYTDIEVFTLIALREPEDIIPPIGDEYEQLTFYFNSYAFEINNVTGYAMTEETPNEMTFYQTSTSGSASVSWGARVWLVYSESSIELTGGSPIVIGTLNGENETMLSNDLNITERSLIFGYGALQLNLYSRWDAGSWTVRAVFVSDYLYYRRIMDTNGFIQLYVNRTEDGGLTYSTAYWGTTSYLSGVGDLTLQSPRGYDWQGYYLNKGNFVSFITVPYVAFLGNGFYALALFAVGMSVYIRYRQFSMVALFVVLLSGGGSILGGVINLVVGEVFIGAVWLVAAFGIALVYWRVFR